MAKIFGVTTDWLIEDDSLAIKERPQTSTVTFIGENGAYVTIQLHENEIDELKQIAQKMRDKDKTTK